MLNGRRVNVRVGGDFDPIPVDKYTCQITDVELVEQHKYQSTEMEEVLKYKFQILDDKPITDQSGVVVTDDQGNPKSTRGRLLFKRVSLSMGGQRSWLNKLSVAVNGRELTKSEKENFDVESLVGQQVDVMTEQSPSKTDSSIIYDNIISFSKTTKKLEPVSATKEAVTITKTTTSVPVDAPADENVEDFLNGLDKTSKDGQTEVTEEAVDPVKQAEEALAKAKALAEAKK